MRGQECVDKSVWTKSVLTKSVLTKCVLTKSVWTERVGERAGEGGRREAEDAEHGSTESKTRTPHKVVGNKA